MTVFALLLTGCAGSETEETPGRNSDDKTREVSDLNIDAKTEAEEEPEILHFVDVYQNPYQVEINPDVEKHNYKAECFIHSGDLLAYEGDENYTYRLGVDVSEHQ